MHIERSLPYDSLTQAQMESSIANPEDKEGTHNLPDDLLSRQEQGCVVDRESHKLVQTHDLYSTLNHAITTVGLLTLSRSLQMPLISTQEIGARHSAIEELKADDRLSSAISDYLHEYAMQEKPLYYYLNWYPNTYKGFKKFTDAGATTYKAAQAIPEPESDYLRIQTNALKSFGESSTYQLLRGPIYRTPDGLKPSEEINMLTPRLRYRHGFLTRGSVMPAIAGASAGLSAGIWLDPFVGLPFLFIIPSAVSCKIIIDKGTVFDPLAEKVMMDESFRSAVAAAGKLDELQSFITFSKDFPHPTSLPKITDDPHHYFQATELYNPVLGKQMPDYVPNEVDLHDRLTFITGPNSGGKSTLGRTIIQNQLMAQIGCFVTARDATINIADHIAFQAPQYDALQDLEGRFGTEMQRTKEIFYSTTPRSLVILDELSEGTTYEEKMRVSSELLEDFRTIGGTTLVMTHNHELVSKFQQEGNGHYFQVEFDGENPTHRIIDGISTNSHAERVLEKIKFTREDRSRHLRGKGYI